MTFPIFKFRGDTNTYTDIAVRGSEHLGLDLEPHYHGKEGLFLVVRLVIHSDDGHIGPFKHFAARHNGTPSTFVSVPDDESPAVEFHGVRVNKFMIRLFDGDVPLTTLAPVGDQFGIWAKIAGWIREQYKADGFTSAVTDLAATVREEVLGKGADLALITMNLQFPDLAAFKAKKSEQKTLPASFTTDDGDEEDDNDDADNDDETDDDGETIN